MGFRFFLRDSLKITIRKQKMKKENTCAETIVKQVCKIKKNEKVLIVANPETSEIAEEIYQAVNGTGAKPSLIYQNVKTSFDAAEDAVLGAIKSEPDVMFSISHQKLGKDPHAAAEPYTAENGTKYDHIFDYLLSGKKTMRAVWTPGLTRDMFERTANIDYAELAGRCRKLSAKFKDAVSVKVTTPGGTDLTVPVKGRAPLSDDGDFSKPGTGGNIPAGEVFISPVVGSGNIKDKKAQQENPHTGCQGTIVYDGSMTFSDGDSIIETPIKVKVEDGFVTSVEGGAEAKRLLKSITDAESKALQMEKEGKLPEGMGETYCRNARNIGELGIGLNPAAIIGGNMLEDEKAFRTCHFAIGANYDDDAPALIHLDGVVRTPTIVINYSDGTSFTALENGSLKI